MNAEHTAPGLLKSFWMAGFEGASHINSSGRRLDMVHATQHDAFVDSDYAMLREVGIQVVRESCRWHLIERYGQFDFSSLQPMLDAANRHGIQICWTLCHYGWPDDIDLFSAKFIHRFVRFVEETAQYIADHSSAEPLYSPINEISFICWAICHSDLMYPYAIQGKGRDDELKRQLVRASIEAIEAVWAVDPRTRIIHVDPIIHIVAPPGRPDLEEAARAQRNSMFEAWDMLRGSRNPELGGDPKYLDIIGVNYYHSNQWEYLSNDRLFWHLHDPRRIPLSSLLQEVYERYRVPLLIGETSHVGHGRAAWIREIGEEVRRARSAGVPVEGICLYPIVDRTDWENVHHWHNSGLWDVAPDAAGRLQRVINDDYRAALQDMQRLLCRESDSLLQVPPLPAGG
jgi:beta-glucosidase/6-phospho-beta-glucosidase/beta-galactosidase